MKVMSYMVHGIGIRSSLPLPELLPSETVAEAVVRLGHVDRLASETAIAGICFRGTSEEVYLFYKDVGAFLVRSGIEIIVDPARGVEESVLRLYILGPVLAVLLHQRGRLILHASAVAVDGGVVAFLGGSGWGKSTMAAALYARGCVVVADDVVAVALDGENDPIVFPSYPQLKLWPDATACFENVSKTLPRVHPQFEKRALPVGNGFSRAPYPLTHIYVLEEGTDPMIESLGKQDVLVELVRHSYAVRLLQPINASLHFLQCAKLVSKVPVRRLKRPRSLSALPELARLVEEDLAQPVS